LCKYEVGFGDLLWCRIGADIKFTSKQEVKQTIYHILPRSTHLKGPVVIRHAYCKPGVLLVSSAARQRHCLVRGWIVLMVSNSALVLPKLSQTCRRWSRKGPLLQSLSLDGVESLSSSSVCRIGLLLWLCVIKLTGIWCDQGDEHFAARGVLADAWYVQCCCVETGWLVKIKMM
jgi:hypothetical protein